MRLGPKNSAWSTPHEQKDYKKQNAQLTKKLESKSFGHIRNIPSVLIFFI
jgi:hypothetical protein